MSGQLRDRYCPPSPPRSSTAPVRRCAWRGTNERLRPMSATLDLDHPQASHEAAGSGGLDDGVERLAVLAVAVAEQEAQGLHSVSEVGGEVSGLLRCPCPSGMGGDAGD